MLEYRRKCNLYTKTYKVQKIRHRIEFMTNLKTMNNWSNNSHKSIVRKYIKGSYHCKIHFSRL